MFLGWILETLSMYFDICWTCLGHVWDMFGTCLGYFRCHVLGMSWTYFGHVLDMFGTCFGYVLSKFWAMCGASPAQNVVIIQAMALDICLPKC